MPAVTPLHPPPARFLGGLTEVGEGVYGWLQPNGLLGETNAGLVVGNGASLLVDTFWDPRLTRRMLAAMAPLTAEAPVQTVVNTHSDGDHFIGVTPIMSAGPLAGWVAALERLLDLGAKRFVPGPFPVCGPDKVRSLVDYWRWLERAAGERLEAGTSPAATARELVLGDEIAERGFADWLGPERALVSVGTIDAHRRGIAKPPQPRQLIAAFSRMALLARDLHGRKS